MERHSWPVEGKPQDLASAISMAVPPVELATLTAVLTVILATPAEPAMSLVAGMATKDLATLTAAWTTESATNTGVLKMEPAILTVAPSASFI